MMDLHFTIPTFHNNQCLRHINRLKGLEMISTNMLQIQSRCYISWVPYLAQPTKVGVSEYEYIVIPNNAISVIISVSLADTKFLYILDLLMSSCMLEYLVLFNVLQLSLFPPLLRLRNYYPVMYCSPIWRPNLIYDITALERVQIRATKYVLNDFSSDYKFRLISLQILPSM